MFSKRIIRSFALLLGLALAIAVPGTSSASVCADGPLAPHDSQVDQKALSLQQDLVSPLATPNPGHCETLVSPGTPLLMKGGTIKWIGGVKYICYPCIKAGSTWACTSDVDPIRYLSSKRYRFSFPNSHQ